MHPGFVAHNPETLLRLRSIAGPSIGYNYDPSHMFWQNIDQIAAIRVLGEAVFYVHAKDTQIYSANLPKTGVLDTKPYTDERNRSWIFRTCGYGHDASWWKEFISTPQLIYRRSIRSRRRPRQKAETFGVSSFSPKILS
jgi:sugar phosphate isomerase/epimerase